MKLSVKRSLKEIEQTFKLKYLFDLEKFKIT